MSLFTSTNFASANASGTDWRDTSKIVLEKLESVRNTPDYFNFGFLYISDHLADDTTSIFNLFRSVMKIDDWVGSVGMGVVGCGNSFVDVPAISAMVCRFPKDSFCVFPESHEDQDISSDAVGQERVKKWLGDHMPMLTVVHGDPMADADPQIVIRDLESTTNSFVIGGVTSSRSEHYQIANAVLHNSVSGVFFADTVPVSTTLSQGCEPISDFHTITKSDEYTIVKLNDRPALEVLQEDLRTQMAKESGKKLQSFTRDFKSLENSDQIPEEFSNFFKGKVHAALPLSQSDQNDFLVRNIMGVDINEGSIAISEHVLTGNTLLFVQRDQKTMASDLTRSLLSLRQRVETERGTFEPKGGLYVSCIARGFPEDKTDEKNEMEIIRDVIGDIPLTGFYAGGEINNARLYGYTGIITLFF